MQARDGMLAGGMEVGGMEAGGMEVGGMEVGGMEVGIDEGYAKLDELLAAQLQHADR